MESLSHHTVSRLGPASIRFNRALQKGVPQALWSQRGSLEGLPTKFTKVFIKISEVCWENIKILGFDGIQLNCTRVQEVASPPPSEAFPSTSYQTLTLCTELTFICNLTKATVMYADCPLCDITCRTWIHDKYHTYLWTSSHWSPSRNHSSM